MPPPARTDGHDAGWTAGAAVGAAPADRDDPTPAAGAWHTGAGLPVALAEIAGAVIDQAIYVGGGFTPPGGSVAAWFGRYDTADDAWAKLADLPVAVHHPMMAAAAGRVWLAGGYTGALNASTATRRLDAYDPAANRWTAMPDMPGRRAAGFMVALDGRLYVVGGIGDAEDRMWVYDVAAGSWSDAPGPTKREHLGAAVSGGRVYVVAGRGFGRGNTGVLEAYDPAAGTWARLPDMPGVCGGCSAAATADGRIHVTGGEGGGRTYDDHFVYDPAAGAWSVAEPMPTARHGIAAAAVGARFYVIGGGLKQGLDHSTLVEWWAPVAPGPLPDPTEAPPRLRVYLPHQGRE